MFETYIINDEGFSEISAFKTTLAHAIREVEGFIPECREKSIFMTKMEEAVFFGTKAIASKDGNFKEVKAY